MKNKWKQGFFWLNISLLLVALMIIQTSDWALKVGWIKVNPIYSIIIIIILTYSINGGLLLTLGVGLVYDLLSNNEMGFYMTSYFISLLPLILWAEKLRSNLVLSLFLLIVFSLTTFKMVIEVILLAFIYDKKIGLSYLQGTGLLEVIFTTLFSIIPYAGMRLWLWMRRRLAA